jgi:hypothetical protein
VRVRDKERNDQRSYNPRAVGRKDIGAKDSDGGSSVWAVGGAFMKRRACHLGVAKAVTLDFRNVSSKGQDGSSFRVESCVSTKGRDRCERHEARKRVCGAGSRKNGVMLITSLIMCQRREWVRCRSVRERLALTFVATRALSIADRFFNHGHCFVKSLELTFRRSLERIECWKVEQILLSSGSFVHLECNAQYRT